MTTAIILAGGLGTRLRSAVPDLPKPMAPVNGRPFLEYQLDYWIGQGITRFVLSVGYKHELISKHFGTHYKKASLDYVVEPNPLGTGGGLLLAAEKILDEEAFLLLNGDTYFAVDLAALQAFSAACQADWSFSLFRAAEEGRYLGMLVSPQGQITALKSSAPGALANGGAYWVKTRSLQNCGFSSREKVSLEDSIFPAILTSGQRLYGLECNGIFIDIGVPDDYRRAQALLTT